MFRRIVAGKAQCVTIGLSLIEFQNLGVKVFEMEFLVYDEFTHRPEVNFIRLLFCVKVLRFYTI